MPIFADCIRRGTRAAQPLPAHVTTGTLYFVTDEGVTERSSGAAWEVYSGAGGGGGGVPLPHAPSHAAAGSDALAVTALSGYPGDGGLFLNGLGAFTAPPTGGGGGGVVTIPAGTLAAQPTGLGPADAGRLYMVLAPYFHCCRWDGAKWTFAPGDPGNGFVAYRPLAPQEPGWVICGGGVTDYLLTGGPTLTAAAFTLPDMVGNQVYFKAGATYDPTIFPPFFGQTGPGGGLAGVSGAGGAHSHGGATAGDGGHTHTAAAAPVGDHQHNVPGMGMTGPSASQNADSGSSFGAARSDHTHTTIPTATDPAGAHGHPVTVDPVGAHAHGVSVEAAHTHSVALPDHVHLAGAYEPQRMAMPVYFRR
jgi:hypothetical protein